jgi:hypothetical protein
MMLNQAKLDSKTSYNYGASGFIACQSQQYPTLAEHGGGLPFPSSIQLNSHHLLERLWREMRCATDVTIMYAEIARPHFY